MMRLAIALVVLAVPFVPASAEDKPFTTTGKNGMVVCVSPEAADIGVAVLKQGGNAVDAAVAVGFAMAVTWPEAGNIGGGGFMLVSKPGAEPTFFDYREKAPASVTRDTFVKTNDWHNHQAVGVPGTVRGLELAHKKLGKLPWKDLVMPAVKLADEGFIFDGPFVRSINDALMRKGGTDEFHRVFGKNGKADWKVGDRFVQKDLAKSLRKIAEQGADAFYTGELADLFVAEMKPFDGFITKEDLANYSAKERKPIHGTYRGFDIYGAPPPSSGGTAVVEMLNILETFDLSKHAATSPDLYHLRAEAMRRAYADRARYLGDPDFVKVPDFLTSKEHAKKLAATIDPGKATPSGSLAEGIPLAKESDHTTHFSIIDSNGMAVSNTYTLEDSFGSRVVVRGAGFILNNEMGDFNSQPGVSNTKGRIGTEPNVVAPGKRMLSSMSPTIIAKDGKPLLVTGSPGGRTIPNTVLCVITNVIDFKMDIAAAVAARREHHQWFPDELQLEGTQKGALTVYGEYGHKSKLIRKQGDAHSIWIDPATGVYHGAADRRINGKAAGY
ncbi:MAG TPA: gamma-glutamyltransferase [Gemmataceae bacterium]|nr:gamma-glutamyltransferase [Gemmataceae bacterium]